MSVKSINTSEAIIPLYRMGTIGKIQPACCVYNIEMLLLFSYLYCFISSYIPFVFRAQ